MVSRSLVERGIAWLVRHPWRVLVVALVLTALGVAAIVDIPMYTSRKALLPQDAPVSRRLNRYLEKFGAASELIVFVEGAPRPVLERFADELVPRLEVLEQVSFATARIDLRFFFDHAYLLVPPRPLAQFASLLQKLIGLPPPEGLDDWEPAFARAERWLERPPALSTVDVDMHTAEGGLHLLHFFLEEWQRWIEAPRVPAEIDWQRLLSRHAEAEMIANGGYFTTRSGDMLFVFVRAASTSEEYDAVAPLIEGVRAEAGALRDDFAARGQPAPRVALAGLPAVSYEEFAAIRHDVVFTVCTAAFFILLLIGVWLRSARWALVVFVPMGLGVVWNIGVIHLLVGHMTMVTSGFTAILFGLGVDYGIFMSTRVLEERRRGIALREAIARGSALSARALLTAGGATVLIFAALGTVPFSGFAELGQVAAGGVLMVLLGTFLVQPAVFVLLHPEPASFCANAPPRREAGAPWLKISPAASVVLVVVAIAAAIGGAMAGSRLPFDYDLLSLLPADSEALRYQRRMETESDYQAEMVIFTADDMTEARRIAEAAARLPSIARIQTVTDLFPPDDEARLHQARQIGAVVSTSEYLRRILALGEVAVSPAAMERIVSSLDKARVLIEDSQEMAFDAGHKHLVALFEKVISRMDALRALIEARPEPGRARTQEFTRSILAKAREGFDLLSSWRYARPLLPDQLPQALRSQFIAPDGTVAVYAHPAESVYDPQHLEQLNHEVLAVSPEATGFPTTHQVFSHMAITSFRQGTLLAVVIAMAWILLVLRSGTGFIIALLPLLVGGGWMMGLMALGGMKFSYANIIALPLVMGLAVDYGVWFAHRRSEMEGQSPWRVAVVAGRAILLAAGTTLAGLGAISLASYRGIASMGISVTLGLVCCVTAALLVSPAMAHMLFGRKS